MTSPLREYAEYIEKCSLCGLCQPVCPAFALTGRKEDGPWGKMTLLRAYLARSLHGDEILRSIEHCAACGRCDSACPAGLPLKLIFQAARFELEKWSRKNFPARSLKGYAARKPTLLNIFQPALWGWKKISGKRTDLLSPLPIMPWIPERNPEKSGSAIALFTGCIARRIYPCIIRAAVKALRAHGHDPVFVANEACCGRPFMMKGAFAQTKKLIQHNLDEISAINPETLLTICPGCQDAIARLWPVTHGLDEKERSQARHIAAITMDMHSFLARNPSILKAAPPKLNADFVWHKPCLQNAVAARDATFLISQVCGVEYMEYDPCCGGAMNVFRMPGFGGKNVDSEAGPPPGQLGERAAKNLRDAVMARGHRVITACPGCMLALDKALRGDKIGPAHSLEIYASAIDEAVEA